MRAIALPSALVVGASVLLSGTAVGLAQRPAPAAPLLQSWVKAVEEHTPGSRDASLEVVWAWSLELRSRLSGRLPVFLFALTGRDQRAYSEDDNAIINLGATEAGTVGRNVFLQRAAMLEADAVVLAVGPLAAVTAPSPPPESARQLPTSSPLLPSSDMVMAKDGETLGLVTANWHWAFARSLLDLIVPAPATAPFVADWYHATSVYLLQHRSWGEAHGQLDRAGALLPDDARILFDRACLSEIMGLPESQQLLSNEDLAALRMRSVAGWRLPTNAPRASDTARRSGIVPAEVANEEAEQLFRRALKVDPTLLEARVRLARLLEERGQYKEAARELDTALNDAAIAGDRPLAFDAHLFAARAARELDQFDAADRHVRAARQLFPHAQSAAIEASALALLRGRPDALDVLHQMDDVAPDPSRRSDPWWFYDEGPGRHADTLLSQLWTRAHALGK